MATPLYMRAGRPPLWSNDTTGSSNFFNTYDASRSPAAGADTVADITFGNSLSTTIGTGAGSAVTVTSVSGPTAGKMFAGQGHISAPVAAAVTISGTITFNLCGSESSMSANATFRVQVYKVSAQGELTLIVDSTLGTELGTALARSTWTASPTSTGLVKGDRILTIHMIDDATATTMGSGFTISLQLDGSNANTADSNITFTETITFTTADPTGSTYYLRDIASDISGYKALNTVQGSSAATAVHTTLAGPLTFPGDQWTATAGGADIGWMSPQFDAFTLSGPVKLILGTNGVAIEGRSSPFDAVVVALAVCDADGTNPVIWAYSYTGSPGTANTQERYFTGDDLAVGQGQRFQLIVYSDDRWPNNQVSGTNRTIRYDGTGAQNAGAAIVFPQTLTEATPGIPDEDFPWMAYPQFPDANVVSVFQ